MLRQSQLMKFLLSKSYRTEKTTAFTFTRAKKKCTFNLFPISCFLVVVVVVFFNIMSAVVKLFVWLEFQGSLKVYLTNGIVRKRPKCTTAERFRHGKNKCCYICSSNTFEWCWPNPCELGLAPMINLFCCTCAVQKDILLDIICHPLSSLINRE